MSSRFFTECPYGRKAVSGCTAFSGDKKSFDTERADEFFTECPYGRRLAKEHPYSKEIFTKADKKHGKFHGHGSDSTTSSVDEFFTECPYGRKITEECPYGKEILAKADKKHAKSHGFSKFGDLGKTSDYASEFFTECPYGRNLLEECPYGKQILAKAEKKYKKAHGFEKGSSAPVNKFFTECPYGRKLTSKCPYSDEIMSKAKHGSGYHHSHDSYKSSPNFMDDFFVGCPYGREVAAKCPYGHEVCEKAGVKVPELKSDSTESESSSESAKCPVSGASGSSGKCPVASSSSSFKKGSSANTPGKCPVGGKDMKCPINPHYTKTLRPVLDFYESDNEFKVFVELPGVEKSDVKVDVKDRVLTLEAEAKSAQAEDSSVRFTEREFGVYKRTLPLPSNASADKIKAKLDNGVLTIIVPKSTPSVTKSVTVD